MGSSTFSLLGCFVGQWILSWSTLMEAWFVLEDQDHGIHGQENAKNLGLIV
jgi:hypothetical protein